MGQPVLKFYAADLESLRIASNLGESVLVESLPTPSGPVPVVAAGTLLFTRNSFITFWMWLCMGGKWYQNNIVNSEHSLVSEMKTLNPEIYHYCKQQQTDFVEERFISFLFSILNRNLAKMSPETRFDVFKRVLGEMD